MVKIFISPNLPIGEDHSVSLTDVASSSNHLGNLQAAPPDYGNHQLDRLYADVDPAGYMTPLEWTRDATNAGTGSYIGPQAEPPEHTPSPRALEERLSRLQEGERPQQNSRDAVSTRLQRSNSVGPAGDPGAQTPMTGQERREHVEYDIEALSKMPSYQTALRTPVRTPFSEVPPTYETATSRPPSPTRQSPILTRLPGVRESSAAEEEN